MPCLLSMARAYDRGGNIPAFKGEEIFSMPMIEVGIFLLSFQEEISSIPQIEMGISHF